MKEFMRHLFSILGTGFLISAVVLLNGRLVIAGEPGDDSHHRAPVPVRDVDNPANEPFESFVCVSSGKSFTRLPRWWRHVFTIPLTTNSAKTTKRYVIEYVSGIRQTSPGEGITQVFLAIPSGEPISRACECYFQQQPGKRLNVCSAEPLYVTPGQTVQIGTRQNWRASG